MEYCKIGDVYYCFVADVYNNRVLGYKGETVKSALESEPVLVLGQKDFMSSTPGNAMNKMNWPMSVTCDTWTQGGNKKYRLYVADTENDRVLVFNDIVSLENGATADFALNYISKDLGYVVSWPWSIDSVDVNGKQKLIVTGTVLGRVGIYNVPTDSTWNNPDLQADVVLDFGIGATPRAITWTGTQLLLGDENIPTDGGSRSGFWVFNGFPTKSGKVSEGGNDYFKYFPEVGYAEGCVINKKLYMLYLGGWNIFHQDTDGKYISGPEEQPDIVTHCVRGAGDSRYDEKGYFVNAGGTQKSIYVEEEQTMYMALTGRSAIVGWTNPEEQLSSVDTMAPDIFIGNQKYATKVNEAASDYLIHNPDMATDGSHLVVVNDLDCQLYVYKNIPTSDGAQPDWIYDVEIAPKDVTLYTDPETNQTTMIVATTAHNTLYIWEDYKFDGAQPTRVLANVIGNRNYVKEHCDMYDVAYDGKYFYLGVTENGGNNVYVFKGIPQKNDNYIGKIQLNAGDTYGWVSSNGTYISINDNSLSTEAADGSAGAVIHKTSKFENATVENPIILNESDSEAAIYRVNTGGDEGERVSFMFPGDCIVTSDGKVAIADSGNNRVIIWNSIEDAKNNTENVTILGRGDDYYGSPATFKTTFHMPKRLVCDGKNLWVGEFKFSNRLLRFEMK